MYNHSMQNSCHYLQNYVPPSTEMILDDGFVTSSMYAPATPEEVCCIPSNNPNFTSQYDTEFIVVSPKDIHSYMPDQMDNYQPSMSYPHTYVHNRLSEFPEHFVKPRSKSVDIPPTKMMVLESEASDDEESTRSTQSQFYMEMTDDELDEDMSIDDDNESIELDYSSYRTHENPDQEVYESPYEITDIDGIDQSHLTHNILLTLRTVTLQVSKTPCLDALAFCVALRLGAHQTPEGKQRGEIVVTNANKFLNGIHLFCPKKSQTQNDEARIKALKRWFDGIPAKRKRNQPFVMRIKENKTRDVRKIIRKMTKFVAKNNLLGTK